jgi:5'-nucleotidase
MDNYSRRPQILLTNDDGIQSPGLWAAAKALSTLGFVTVAAPRDQASGAGRSLPNTSDGRILSQILQIGGQSWQVYAVGGTPAQVVEHAVLEIMPEPPDLVVSGINYGENIGTSITVSGTVGAAIEGAALGIPSMAVSLQVRDPSYFFSNSEEIDFSCPAYFTHYFARVMLEKRMPADVDMLKVDIPIDATPDTPWEITRQSRDRYYVPISTRRGPLDQDGPLSVEMRLNRATQLPKTDIHTLIYEKKVSVTPLSLDLTSRVDGDELEKWMRGI